MPLQPPRPGGANTSSSRQWRRRRPRPRELAANLCGRVRCEHIYIGSYWTYCFVCTNTQSSFGLHPRPDRSPSGGVWWIPSQLICGKRLWSLWRVAAPSMNMMWTRSRIFRPQTGSRFDREERGANQHPYKGVTQTDITLSFNGEHRCTGKRCKVTPDCTLPNSSPSPRARARPYDGSHHLNSSLISHDSCNPYWSAAPFACPSIAEWRDDHADMQQPWHADPRRMLPGRGSGQVAGLARYTPARGCV